MKNATQKKVLTFPTEDVRMQQKIDRLTALKIQYDEVNRIQKEIIDECMMITGEEEPNGHTFGYLEDGDPRVHCAADIFVEMKRNPSELWRSLDAVDAAFG